MFYGKTIADLSAAGLAAAGRPLLAHRAARWGGGSLQADRSQPPCLYTASQPRSQAVSQSGGAQPATQDVLMHATCLIPPFLYRVAVWLATSLLAVTALLDSRKVNSLALPRTMMQASPLPDSCPAVARLYMTVCGKIAFTSRSIISYSGSVAVATF